MTLENTQTATEPQSFSEIEDILAQRNLGPDDQGNTGGEGNVSEFEVKDGELVGEPKNNQDWQTAYKKMQSSLRKNESTIKKNLTDVQSENEGLKAQIQILTDELNGIYLDPEKKVDVEKIRKARSELIANQNKLKLAQTEFEGSKTTWETKRTEAERQNYAQRFSEKYKVPADTFKNCKTPKEMLDVLLKLESVKEGKNLPRANQPNVTGSSEADEERLRKLYPTMYK